MSLASDIALVIDDSGVITSVAQSSGAPISPAAERWVGRPWVETVTGETRRKIELMLDDVSAHGVARRREVNHGDGGAGGGIPVAYTAVRLGKDGPVIAVGRDLRTVAAIQQRFHDTQRELERSYWHTRQTEARHDLLVQVATDAVLVVDAQTLQITAADNAAAALLAEGQPLRGMPALHAFDPASRGGVRELLAQARASGRPAEIHARLTGDSHAMVVSATPFRAAGGMRLLLRVRPLGAGAGSSGGQTRRALAWRADRLRDAVVVTDSSGRILGANPPFLILVQANAESELRGHPIGDWLGRGAADVPALIQGVQEDGLAMLAGAALHSGTATTTVDVSAALLADGDQACIGFTMRHTPLADATAAATPDAALALARAVAALAAAVGQVPLAELLHQGQKLVLRHLAQAALQRCGGDATAAAAMLDATPRELATLLAEAQDRPAVAWPR